MDFVVIGFFVTALLGVTGELLVSAIKTKEEAK